MVLNIFVIHCLFINQITCVEKISFIYASTFHMQRKPLKVVCIWQADHCDNKRFKQQDISLLSVTSSNFAHSAYTIQYFQALWMPRLFFFLWKTDYIFTKFVIFNVSWKAKNIPENAENLHNLPKLANLSDRVFPRKTHFKVL